MASKDWARKISDVPEGTRRQWRAGGHPPPGQRRRRRPASATNAAEEAPSSASGCQLSFT